MAAISPTAHAAPQRWRSAAGVRAALGVAGRRVRETTSTARRRYRRPVLVVSSFASFDVAAWQISAFAGWAVLGALLFVFESLTGGDEDEVSRPGTAARPEQRRR